MIVHPSKQNLGGSAWNSCDSACSLCTFGALDVSGDLDPNAEIQNETSFKFELRLPETNGWNFR